MPGKKKEPVVEEKFQALDLSAKDLRTVVLLLQSPENAIVCKACQALQHHMEKSEHNCLEVKDLGVVAHLVTLLESLSKAVRSYAVMCLAILAVHLPVKRILLKLDFLPSLLALLKPEEELVSIERASFIVSHLAEEYSFKVKLVEANILEALVLLLSHSDSDVQKNSVKSLSLIAQHHLARPAIAESQGFPAFFPLLESEYREIQELSLVTLQLCLHDDSCRNQFLKDSGLAKLTDFLSNAEWNDLHVLAVEVLSLCLLGEGGMEALHSSDCLQKLLASITDSTVPGMKAKATKALASASRDPVSQKILHESKAEIVFIELLTSQDAEVLQATCDALRTLSSLASSKQRIGTEGGLKKLVPLLHHAGPDVRSASSHALSCLIHESHANCLEVGEISGGIEALVSLLEDEQATCRLSSASCIISLASISSLRADLIDEGAVPGLADCLSHTDTGVQAAAAQALAGLACDSAAREQFPEESMSALINLLGSTCTEVCHSTAWALSVLAQSSNIASAVFKTRGGETLKKLSEESPHREVVEFARLAFQRLLDNDLSAKYAFTGCLTLQDKIVNMDFFDGGMAKSSKKFVPLEELVKEPASLNRPVLVVSLLAPPPPTPSIEVEPVVKEEATPLEGRAKSRAQGSSGTKSKKLTKSDQQIEAASIEEAPESSLSQTLLAPDSVLWNHISFLQKYIQPLESVEAQARKLAKYVAVQMGGPLLSAGSFPYQLSQAQTQADSNSNLLPLGSVQQGSYQHRALLYKVMADQIGLPCSLHRGQYGCHWNTVALWSNGSVQEHVVDIMFNLGQLYPVGGSKAATYTKV